MSGRLIAIGDVHGCRRALQKLLEAVNPQSADTIVTLGDYIDRGPDARGVIEEMLLLTQKCRVVPLLGNHEAMLLAVERGELTVEAWAACGGMQTLVSYGGDIRNIPDEHFDWLRELVAFHETERHLFVHANYSAELDLPEQPLQLMLWEHLSLTIPPPHKSGKTAVVGHTPQLDGEVLDLGHLLCLDTFCCGGKWLTARDLESGRTWQASMWGRLREEDNHGPSQADS